MNTLQTKASTKLAKHYASQNDEVSDIKAAILVLEASLKVNKDKLSKMEAQYSNVASEKLNRKVKEGADVRKAESHQHQLNTAMTKKERVEREYDAKIEALQRKKEEALAAVDETICYFKKYVERYYDSVPEVIVSYPPSYYGIKEEIETAERQLTMWKNTLLVVLEQQINAVESPEEKQLKLRREQARREDAALAIEVAARQREEEGRINMERKAAFAAEEERIKERNRQKANTLVTPKEDSKKMAIRLAEMKASEELRAMNGEVEVKEESDKEEEEEKEKDEDLLEDRRWCMERGLPVPESTLQKLRDRKLI